MMENNVVKIEHCPRFTYLTLKQHKEKTMKTILTYTLMLVCAFSVSAKDACSPQIKGYVTGLNAGATLAGIS